MTPPRKPVDSAAQGPFVTDPARQNAAEAYFEHFRTDVLALVPESARSILSVGCGAGSTETALIQRGCRVTGLEMDHAAAARARNRGVEIIEGDVAHSHAQLTGRAFDCLIYADVLEHLVDPVAVLRDHVALLLPDGYVVVSVPNFRHYSVFAALFLRGHCDYADAGIFDRTHLRITTRKMVEQWFTDVGVVTDVVGYRIPRRRERWLSTTTFGLFEEFLACQVVLRGVKPERPAWTV